MLTIEYMIELTEQWVNGNRKYTLLRIQKMSRSDRARMVSVFRSYVDTKTAFEIADHIIKGEY